MMKATVIRAFLRNEIEMLPGQVFECSSHEYHKLLSLGFVQGYETKVEPPAEPNKKKRSASSRRARPAKKKTAKRSRKSATKS